MTMKNILLTGRPGCGKTTLIKRVVEELALPAGGFYTEEIRQRGERVGFKIITLSGEEAVFADVDFRTPQRLGKYGLDLAALETVGFTDASRLEFETVRKAMHSFGVKLVAKPIEGKKKSA